MRKRLLPVLGLCLTAGPACAASFNLFDDKERSIITITGDLGLGDEQKFSELALTTERAVVVLNSPGGNLVAGIRIGRTIRVKEFVTLVPGDRLCASACALAWLGGQVRWMSPNAKIGFHAAFSNDGDKPEISSMGNALVEAYLNSLGLSERAAIFITKAPPQGMSWLSLEEAGRHGIAVSRFYPMPRTAVPPERPTRERAKDAGR